jgi:hypothetical protein
LTFKPELFICLKDICVIPQNMKYCYTDYSLLGVILTAKFFFFLLTP